MFYVVSMLLILHVNMYTCFILAQCFTLLNCIYLSTLVTHFLLYLQLTMFSLQQCNGHKFQKPRYNHHTCCETQHLQVKEHIVLFDNLSSTNNVCNVNCTADFQQQTGPTTVKQNNDNMQHVFIFYLKSYSCKICINVKCHCFWGK